MGVDMKVKAIYDSEIGNITRSEKNWKDVLKVAGQLYRYEFDNIVMVTAQRPPEKSTLISDCHRMPSKALISGHHCQSPSFP